MPKDVAKWLAELGLDQYSEAFAENAIDFRALPALTEADLKELGVKLGHRRVFQRAVAALSETEAVEEWEATDERPSLISSTTDAERRQLTVMFCDLAGSTEISQTLDPEDLREVNRAYQDACNAAIERYEGYVARYMGDGVLACFGYPIAHEDDAERAIHAALGVVQSATERDEAVGDMRGVGPGVRVGIATGLVAVGDRIGGVISTSCTH